MVKKKILRFNIHNVENSLLDVEKNWRKIDDKLDFEKIGRRDIFDSVIRDQMINAYRHLDKLLEREVEPFSLEGISQILELNNIVHYGFDFQLRLEYNQAIEFNSEKFAEYIIPIEE